MKHFSYINENILSQKYKEKSLGEEKQFLEEL